SRSNLVPGGGNSLDLIPTLPRSPLHPLFERFGMRVERAGTAVELFRKQECEPLAACPRLPTRRELKFVQQRFREASEQARHVKGERSRLGSIAGKPIFLHSGVAKLF